MFTLKDLSVFLFHPDKCRNPDMCFLFIFHLPLYLYLLLLSLGDCYDEKYWKKEEEERKPHRTSVLTARSQSKSIHLLAVNQLYRLQPAPNPCFHLRPKARPFLLPLTAC